MAEGWTIPVDRYPDPVCRYTVEGGRPVVDATNDPFDAVFGTETTGTAVSDLLDAQHVGTADLEDTARTLADGGQFDVTVRTDDGDHHRYAARAVPSESGDGGALVFTRTGETDGSLGVDHVASVVSHDLRNPLDVAKARLRAGREYGEDEHFEHVAQAHERMDRIIEDVLTLARGEDVVDPEDAVDLGAVAETAWETVETNGARLTHADPLPTAVADPDRVGRLFENLFRNCVEHAADNDPDAGVQVTVGRLDDGFYVADDGPGVPEDEREAVFEPGYSSDDHGTGLGLAIVARIADLHGWSSAITDAEGGGTRVEVRGVEPVEE